MDNDIIEVNKVEEIKNKIVSELERRSADFLRKSDIYSWAPEESSYLLGNSEALELAIRIVEETFRPILTGEGRYNANV